MGQSVEYGAAENLRFGRSHSLIRSPKCGRPFYYNFRQSRKRTSVLLVVLQPFKTNCPAGTIAARLRAT